MLQTEQHVKDMPQPIEGDRGGSILGPQQWSR